MYIPFDASYAQYGKLDFVAEDDNGEWEKINTANRFVSLALMLGDLSLGATESKAPPTSQPA